MGRALMNIVYVEPPNFGHQGDHVYRTEHPRRALGTIDGIQTVAGTILSPAMHTLMAEADVLVLCDAIDADFLPIIARRVESNLLNIFEINDNFLAVQPWNATAEFFRDETNRSLIYQLASSCHGLQFCMPALQRRFGNINPLCVSWDPRSCGRSLSGHHQSALSFAPQDPSQSTSNFSTRYTAHWRRFCPRNSTSADPM